MLKSTNLKSLESQPLATELLTPHLVEAHRLVPQPFLGSTSTSCAPSHVAPSACQHPAQSPILREGTAFTVTSLVKDTVLLLTWPHIYRGVFCHIVGVTATNVRVTLVRWWVAHRPCREHHPQPDIIVTSLAFISLNFISLNQDHSLFWTPVCPRWLSKDRKYDQLVVRD